MSEVQPPEKLKQILEGALLAAGEALSVDKLLSLFEEHERPEKKLVQDVLEEIQSDSNERGFALVEIASGWRFQVDPDLAQWVNRLWEDKPQKYSRALLETLALIAYRQPLTRSDIEEVRGVAVSSHIIKTLAEREWIKVVGHRDVPGRPSLYATTKQFLDYFGLKSLEELPTLGELKDIDSLNERLKLEEDEAIVEQEQIEEAKEDSEVLANSEGESPEDSDGGELDEVAESHNADEGASPEVRVDGQAQIDSELQVTEAGVENPAAADDDLTPGEVGELTEPSQEVDEDASPEAPIEGQAQIDSDLQVSEAAEESPAAADDENTASEKNSLADNQKDI